MYEEQIQRFLKLRAAKVQAKEPTGEGGKDNDEGTPFEARTYLYIRAFDGDTGTRPVPAGQAYWLSPDIEVYDIAAGKYVLESTLVPGTAYRVDVTVHNDGDLPANACNVDLFMADFTVGFSSPPRLGAPQLLAVPAHGQATASFAYTPSSAGHRCLFARAWSLVSMDYPGCDNPDRKLVTQVADYSATMRHIAQQNLDVVQQGQSIDVSLAAGGLKGAVGHLVVQAAGTMPARVKRKLPGLRFAALTAQTAKVLDGVRLTRLEPPVVIKPPVVRPEVITPRLDPAVLRPPVKPQGSTLTRLSLQATTELPSSPTLGKLTAAARAKMRNWRVERAGDTPEKVRLDVPQLGLAPGAMTALHVWLIGPDGARHGGATVIVKG